MAGYAFMAARIVGRLHVSASARDVIRACWRALAPKARNRKLRRSRKALYRAALRAHTKNRELYSFVMHRF